MDRLSAVLESLELKEVERSGWSLRDVIDPESVADHSWGTALLCLIYGPEQTIDTERAVTMAVVHDLAEAKTGDILTRADAADAGQPDRDEKERKERKAITNLARGLDSRDVKELWQEYETRATPEAVFVKDMDLVEMCAQALRYEKDKRYDGSDDDTTFEGLDEFFVSAEERIRTETGKELVAQLKGKYESVKER